MFRRILLLSTRHGIACLSFALVCGCGEEPSSQQSSDESAAKAQATQSSDTNQPNPVSGNRLSLDYTQSTFMAIDLVDAYAADPNAVLEALGGRTLGISGQVSDVGHEIDQGTDSGQLIKAGDPFIKLSSGLKCLTREAKPWKEIWFGDLVLVSGRMSKHELVIIDATIELAGKGSIISIPASNLAAEFSFDAELATAAYEDTPIQVTGTVLEVGYNQAGDSRVLLEGEDGLRISCIFTVFEEYRVAEMEAGDELTATGDFTGFFAGEQIVELSYCVPVKVAK